MIELGQGDGKADEVGNQFGYFGKEKQYNG
jgi:hypothetical protein